MRNIWSASTIWIGLLCSASLGAAQQPAGAAQTGAQQATSAQQPETTPQPATQPKAPADRLALAKNIFVKNAGNNEIPFNVIQNSLEGWGRYTLVDSEEKADVILEITPPDEESSVKSSSSNKTSVQTGKPEQSYETSKTLGPEVIKMVATDVKTKRTLWMGNETVKGALRKNNRDNNLLEAAQRLFTKFHDRVEPLPKK